MQTTYEQAQLNTSATFVEMFNPRKNCPAKDAACNFCQKVGHYFKVCQKRFGNHCIDAIKKTAAIQGPKLPTLSASETSNNTRVLCNVKINGIVAKSLMDTEIGRASCRERV